MKKNILTIIFFFIALFFFLRSCEKSSSLHEVVKYKSDTATIVSSDTIWAKDTIYKNVLYPKYVVDSFFVSDTTSHLCDYVREYSDTIDDTNQTIYYKAFVQGKLMQSNINYKLKIPVTIIDSVNTTITNSYESKYNLYGGVILSKNNITPLLMVNRKSLYLQVGYNLIQKNPVIGAGYRFYFK